jgi:hypothetical protein
MSDCEPARPRTRGDCVNGPRPCPWVGCRHHLYLHIDGRGAIQITMPPVEEWTEETVTCSLDVADTVPPSILALVDPRNYASPQHLSLEQVGHLMGGVSREAIRIVESRAMDRISGKLVDYILGVRASKVTPRRESARDWLPAGASAAHTAFVKKYHAAVGRLREDLRGRTRDLDREEHAPALALLRQQLRGRHPALRDATPRCYPEREPDGNRYHYEGDA